MTSHSHGVPAGRRTSSGSHSFLRKLTFLTKRSKSQPLVASPSYTTTNTTHTPLPTPPSSPPSSSSSAAYRMALAAAKTASLQATVNSGLLTPPSTARPVSRPRTAAPGTASSTLSSRPATCSAPLVVQVEIRFPGLPSYTHEYCSSQNFQVSNRLCKGLLRRLTHCSTELITRRDSKALMQQLRHGHSVSTKPLSYELHFRIVRKDSGLWADKTFCSYQTHSVSRHDAHEVILATHRMIGLFLRRHDPAFRWSDAPKNQAQLLASCVPRPEEPELVSHTVGRPLPLSCIPRSRFLDDSQSFEFVPGYAIKLSFRSRCHSRKQYEWKRAISLQSNQSAPLSLALAEDLLWQTFESVNTALSVRRQAFNDEHQACDFLEGVVSCQHFDEDALDIELKIQNNLGPDYTHLTRSIHSKLALFRHVDGLDCAEFIQNIHGQFVQSRETTDCRVSSLPDFDYRITALKTPAWSLENTARFVLDASTSYSRRSIEAILDRVETGIADVLRHKGCTIHVVAYKRGHLILDKSIVTSSHHTKPSLFPKAPVEEDAEEIVTNLKERIHHDINAVCKDTCSLDSLDNIDDLCESAAEARAFVSKHSSASPPMTPASANQFEDTVVLEQSFVVDDEPVVTAPRVVELPDDFYVDDSRPSSPANSTSPSTRRRAFPLVPEKFILPPSPQPSPPATPSSEVAASVPAEAPVDAPVETQVKAPVEAHIDDPIQAPVEVTMEGPIDTPTEACFETASETSIETPIEATVEAPVETPVEALIKASIETPVEAPVKASVKALVIEPAVKPSSDTLADSDDPPPGQTLLELAEMLAHTLDEIVREMETPDEFFMTPIETPKQSAADAPSEAIDEIADIPEVVYLDGEPEAKEPVDSAREPEEPQLVLEAAVEAAEILAEASIPIQTSEFPVEVTAVATPVSIPELACVAVDSTQISHGPELTVPEITIDGIVGQPEQKQECNLAGKMDSMSPRAPDEASTTEILSEASLIDNITSEAEHLSGEDEISHMDFVEDPAALSPSSPVLAPAAAEEESSESCYESFPEDYLSVNTVSENDSSIETASEPADAYLPQVFFTFDDSESETEEQVQEEVHSVPFNDVSFLYNFNDLEEDPSPIELTFEREEFSFAGAQLDTIFEMDGDSSTEFDFDFPAYDQGFPDIPSADNIQAVSPLEVEPQNIPKVQDSYESESVSSIERPDFPKEDLADAELVSQVPGQVEMMVQQDEDFDGSEYSDDEPLMFSSTTKMSRSNPITGAAPTADSSDHTRPSTPTLSHSSGDLNSPEASFLETPRASHGSHPAMVACFDSDNDTRYGHAYDADGESEHEPHFEVFARDIKPAADPPNAPIVLGESLLQQSFSAPASPTVCDISESDSTPTEVGRETEQITTEAELTDIPPKSALDFSTSTPAFSFELDPAFEDFAATKPDIDLEEFPDVANDESGSEYYNDKIHSTADGDVDDDFQLPDYDGTAQVQQDDQLEVVETTHVLLDDVVESVMESSDSQVKPETLPLPFDDDLDLLDVETEPVVEPAVEPVPAPVDELSHSPAFLTQPVVDTLHTQDLANAFSHGDVDELALSKGGAPSDDSSAYPGNLVESEVLTHQHVELIDHGSELSPEPESNAAQVEPVLAAMLNVVGVPVTCELAVLPTPPESDNEEQYTIDSTSITAPTIIETFEFTAPLEDTTEIPAEIAPLPSAANVTTGLDSQEITSPLVVDISTVEEIPHARTSVTILPPVAKSLFKPNILAPVSAARNPVSWFLPKSGLVGLDESRLVRVGLRGALTGSRAFDKISSASSGLLLHDTQPTIDDDIDLLSAGEEPVTPEHAEQTILKDEPTTAPPLLTVAVLPQAATITKVKEEPKSNRDVILPRVIMAFASMAVMSQMINRSSN